MVTLQPFLPKEPGKAPSPLQKIIYQEASNCLRAKNFTMAFELFTQAANKNYTKARTSLGTFYAEPNITGNIVEKTHSAQMSYLYKRQQKDTLEQHTIYQY